MPGALRLLLVAFAALMTLGAAPEPAVEYRLGVVPQRDGPPLAEVEIRFRGDADGETRLALPDDWASAKDAWRFLTDLRVKGAQVSEPDPAHRVLTHRPNAKITVRYKVRTAYEADPSGGDGNPYAGPILRPGWFALLGEFVFATPVGRQQEPARFRWGRLPKGWRVASDLEHGGLGQPMTVNDLGGSISIGGANVTVTERQVPGGVLRVAGLENREQPIASLADQVAPVVAAQRAYWGDVTGPYLVAFVPLAPRERGSSSGGTGRGDAFVLYATPNAADRTLRTIAHEHLHTWIAPRLGRQASGPDQMATAWFSEGVTDFVTFRTLLRAGAADAEAVVGMMSDQLKAYDDSPARNAPSSRVVAEFWSDQHVRQLPYQQGFLLALKWDEEIRRKSGGKLDLDDVLFRMRDHYRQFAPGRGPDVETGLVSAAWVAAQLDLRPDIARHAVKGETVPLPDSFFGGCVELRAFTRPGFDSGFDHAASSNANVVRGVRRGGPAWTSGLRDGMRIQKMDLRVGDTSREIVLEVRDARGRARTIRYWPYGDNDLETRSLVMRDDLDEAGKAACARRIAGL